MSAAAPIAPPPQRAAGLPASIARELARLRAGLRRRDATLGLARTGIALVGFVLGTFVLDWLIDFPVPFRGVLLGLGALAVAWIAGRHLLAPLAKSRTDDELALAIERAHPELNDELISAVQLSRDLRAFQSRELVESVVAGAAGRMDGIDATRAAPMGEARFLGLLTLGLVGFVGLFAVARPHYASIWFDRMLLLRETGWPRSVELEVDAKNLVVAKGDDLTVTARLVRGQPGRVVMVPRFAAAGRSDELPMAEARGEYRATFENVAEPFKFYVEGGDFRSPWYAVEVRARPKLEEIAVSLEPPAYTGIAPTPQDAPLHDGNLKVPQGTLVRYRGRATTPLAKADILFAAAGSIGDEKKAELEAGDGRGFAGEFRVKETTSIVVRLASKDGFETPAAAQYTIRAIPDRLPDVRIVKPGRNKDVARGGAVPLAIEVRDDYLAKAAALVFSVAKAKRGAPESETRVTLDGVPSADDPKQATVAYTFEMAPLGLEVGDRVTYWVEAVDNRAPAADVGSVPPEMRGKSERYQLHVASDEDLDRQQQNALKRVRDDLAGLEKAERKQEADLEALAGEIGARAGKPDPKDRRALTYGELDERRLGQRLEQVRQALGDVKDEMAANRVAKEEDVRWVGDLEQTVDGLAKDPVARAAQTLGELRQGDKPAPEKVADVARVEGEVADGIQDLERKLDKWDEFNEVLHDLRDVLSNEERIKTDTNDRAKQELKR